MDTAPNRNESQEYPVIRHVIKRIYNQMKARPFDTSCLGVFQPGTLNPWPRPGSDVNAFIPTVTTV